MPQKTIKKSVTVEVDVDVFQCDGCRKTVGEDAKCVVETTGRRHEHVIRSPNNWMTILDAGWVTIMNLTGSGCGTVNSPLLCPDCHSRLLRTLPGGAR